MFTVNNFKNPKIRANILAKDSKYTVINLNIPNSSSNKRQKKMQGYISGQTNRLLPKRTRKAGNMLLKNKMKLRVLASLQV